MANDRNFIKQRISDLFHDVYVCSNIRKATDSSGGNALFITHQFAGNYYSVYTLVKCILTNLLKCDLEFIPSNGTLYFVGRDVGHLESLEIRVHRYELLYSNRGEPSAP